MLAALVKNGAEDRIPRVMTLLIDTSTVPAADRLELWASSSSRHYHPLQIRCAGREPFEGRMWGDWLASVGLFRIAASANTMSRTRPHIIAGDPECLHLSILLKGRLEGGQRDRMSVLAPGDMTTYDTSEPANFHAPGPFDLLVLKLPRATLGKYADQVSQLAGLRIPGQTGLPRLAVRFFCGAATGVADGTIAGGDTRLAEHVLDLVRWLYQDLGEMHRCRAGSRAELRLRARSYIDAHLGDPTLTPEQVARACFISTRYLHRVFSDEGVSVCDWIRSERLVRCRRDLLDPALADEPIAAIAARSGLPGAHISRLFRAAYGCSPRDFRRRGRAGVPAATWEPVAKPPADTEALAYALAAGARL